jgi:hypothetical protein
MKLLLVWLVWLFLLAPEAAWSQTAGIERYEYGDFEAAAQLFAQELAEPQLPPGRQALLRIYLAASLYALGLVEQARKPLEALARERPEVRVDPVRFPPELVEFAGRIHQQAETERQLAAREAALQRAREEARLRAALGAPQALRPEVFGLLEARDRQWLWGAGGTFRRKLLEGSVHVLMGDPPVFQLQGGLLPGAGAVRPFLGLRASVLPGIQTYGGGPILGGRIALPGGLVGLVDLGADYFFARREDRQRFALTVQAGLGFELRVP